MNLINSISDDDLKQHIQILKKHNARLKRIAHDARSKLNAALDGTGLCLWQLDVNSGKLIIFNRRWGAMLGYQPKALTAHFDVWREHLHPEDKEMVLTAFYDHLEGKTQFYEALHRMQAPNGTITWVLDRGRVTEWSDEGKPLKVTGTHIDMTKEKQYEQQLAMLANHDPLTHLANRRALLHQFNQIKKAGPVCVAFIDLDNFKNVNDTFGHRSGDNVLLQLSQRLQDACPPEVTIGRIGGDEFILLLPWALEHPEIINIAKRCLKAAITPFELENGAATVGASIGIDKAIACDNFDDAVIRADESMYLIKHTGKNGIALAARIVTQA